MARTSSLTASARYAVTLILAVYLGSSLAADPPAQRPLELSYVISFPQPHTHLYEVAYTIGNVTTAQLALQMPTWTPGSYLQREFARNVQDFMATDDSGQTLKWQKIDKATWRIETGAAPNQLKKIHAAYRVYANELTVRTSHLDASHAYFNGASVFMYVKGAVNQPLKLKIEAPAGWRATTPLGLAPNADGYYSAPNYDILVDSPTEVGQHNLLEFMVSGKTHRIAIWGEARYNEARLKEDFAKIIEEDARLFGGLPYDHYTFIVHLQPGIGGGLEHLNSTTCQGRPDAFKSRQGYVRFLGLISHEYFHLWNVKRIRPLALGPFDYQTENYTRGLWLSEGVTDYYASLILRRAGLISVDEYLTSQAREIQGFEAIPGRFVQTPETASFDSWIKHYRPDENSVNTTMSYYTSGSLLGLMLDLEIRSRTRGAKSLDDVMRLLLENNGLPKPGFTDTQLKAAFEKAAGGDLTDLFNRYVSGNQPIDFNAWLNRVGARLDRGYQASTPYAESKTDQPGTLGLSTKAEGDRVIVANVVAGLPGYEGGVNANDELIALDGARISPANTGERGSSANTAERVNLLNDLRAGQRVKLTVFRREKLLSFDLTAAVKPFDSYKIIPIKEASGEQLALRRAWLNEQEAKP